LVVDGGGVVVVGVDDPNRPANHATISRMTTMMPIQRAVEPDWRGSVGRGSDGIVM